MLHQRKLKIETLCLCKIVRRGSYVVIIQIAVYILKTFKEASTCSIKKSCHVHVHSTSQRLSRIFIKIKLYLTGYIQIKARNITMDIILPGFGFQESVSCTYT